MRAIEIFKLFGSIFVDNDEANKSIAKTDDNAKSLGDRFTDGVKKAGKWGLGIATAAAGVGTAAFAMTKKVTDNFDAIAKDSAKLGITTDAFQEMSYWAGQNGLSASEMERAVGRLNQRIGLAAEGNDKYAGALEKLGVDMDAVKEGTVSTEDAMATSIQTLSQMTNEQEKSALASELFGTKLARELMPALQEGSLSLEDAKQRAHELGLVIEEDTLRSAETFNDTWDDMTSMLSTFGQKIIVELMPAFQQLMDWVIDHMPQIQAIMQTVFDVVKVAIGVVVEAVTWLIEAFGQLYDGVEGNSEGIRNIIESVFNWIMDFWDTWGSDIISFFQTTWEVLTEVFEVTFEAIKMVISTVFEWIMDFWDEWGEDIVEYFTTTFNLVMDIIKVAVELIWTIVKEIFDRIKTFWDRWGNTITIAFRTIFNVLKAYLEGVWNAIKLTVETVLTLIKNLIQLTLNIIKGDWEGAWENIKNIFEAVWKFITGMFENSLNTMVNVGKELFQGIWDGMKSVWSGIQNWVSEKVSWLTDKLAFWRRGNDEMDDDPPPPGPVDGSHRSGLRYVPRDGYIAELHKGERVLTAAENRALESQAGSQIVIQNMNVRDDSDIKKIAKELFNLQQMASRGKGVLAT